MSIARSDVGAGPAAVAADGAVRDGDAAASSNRRGLSNEPAGEGSSQGSVKRSRTELRTNLRDAIRVEKEKRLKEQRQKSKPDHSSAYDWLFFEVYVLARLQQYAICTLCLQQKNYDRAEIKYNQSPTNLINHLNTSLPGHKEAYQEVKDRQQGLKGTRKGKNKEGAAPHAAGSQPSLMPTYFSPRTPDWVQGLVRWIVRSARPLSTVENQWFRDMIGVLNPRAHIPDRRSLLSTMKKIKASVLAGIEGILEGEHVCITTDGWTSCANDTYMSLTVSFINKAWKLVTFSLNCTKSSGSTAGNDLAEGVQKMLKEHSLETRVVGCVTDCELSMVKMGRNLEAAGVCTHIGCVNHRLEKTTSVVFNGPGVKRAMALARSLATRYTQSSQAADTLERMAHIIPGLEPLKVIQDVVTRWWSSHAMVDRLLYLRPAIEMHETMHHVDAILTNEDWRVLELIRPVLEPFMVAQRTLEGHKYVTDSLVIPTVHDLRQGLKEAIREVPGMRCVSDGEDDDERGAMLDDDDRAVSAVRNCAKALLDDFNERWGDGTTNLVYREGKRRQPQGFKTVQVLSTALDPRTKMLYGFNDDEQEAVWELVVKDATKMANEGRQDTRSESQRRPSSTERPQSMDTLSGTKYPCRLSGFMAAAQADSDEDEGSSETGTADADLVENTGRLQVTAFRGMKRITVYDEDKDKKIYRDPLTWWGEKEATIPLLAQLARRVLAVPATQAHSERLFSCAGNVVTKTHNSLSPEHVELLVFLRNTWQVAEEYGVSIETEGASKALKEIVCVNDA